jgi:hypothetical protein
LGTAICLVPEHNPLVLGKVIATLDCLSEGRVTQLARCPAAIKKRADALRSAKLAAAAHHMQLQRLKPCATGGVKLPAKLTTLPGPGNTLSRAHR